MEALRDWLLRADPAAVAARLRQRAWPAARPAPIRPLAQAAALAGAGRRLPARPATRPALAVGAATGRTRSRCVLFDRTITLPGRARRPCAPCSAAGSVRVGDLPGLDDDADRVTLARRLLREAVLVPA